MVASEKTSQILIETYRNTFLQSVAGPRELNVVLGTLAEKTSMQIVDVRTAERMSLGLLLFSWTPKLKRFWHE